MQPDEAIAGDQDVEPLSAEAVKVLAANHRRFLAFLERRVGDRAAAEDLLQQALLRATEHAPKIIEQEGVVAWFYRLLRNALVDHHRRSAVRSRALELQAGEAAAQPEDEELLREVCQCMHSLLPTLKAQYADMVRRVDLDEMPISDVAKELAITPNNAMVRLHRARKALKGRLEQSCGTCATHGCLDCSCKHGAAPTR